MRPAEGARRRAGEEKARTALAPYIALLAEALSGS